MTTFMDNLTFPVNHFIASYLKKQVFETHYRLLLKILSHTYTTNVASQYSRLFSLS